MRHGYDPDNEYFYDPENGWQKLPTDAVAMVLCCTIFVSAMAALLYMMIWC